ncbi:hypothetical protein [Roseibacillus persicicus]|uniref:hypothetical protein n=1 Tax=Roseibacillus persicicus TaxID=454148 RepID=UPI00280E4317|nr:hypothetical protein [Roseibacillus persicicus]MDQ8192132.1 hypothetical protein [Roseibacillus persicicus]
MHSLLEAPLGRFVVTFLLGLPVVLAVRLLKDRTPEGRVRGNLAWLLGDSPEYPEGLPYEKFCLIAGSVRMTLLASLPLLVGISLLLATVHEGSGSVWSWIAGGFGLFGVSMLFGGMTKLFFKRYLGAEIRRFSEQTTEID